MTAHPLAQELKLFADNPEGHQWQEYDYIADREGWRNCNFLRAMDLSETGATKVRLIPKRRTIPAHLLPEGWEVECVSDQIYRIHEYGRGRTHETHEACKTHADALLHRLLQHIDPEASE